MSHYLSEATKQRARSLAVAIAVQRKVVRGERGKNDPEEVAEIEARLLSFARRSIREVGES